MNAALRTTLGWVAAVLLNLGAVLFVVGLILPRTGDASVLAVGIWMLVAGLIVGAAWLYGSRGLRKR
ncbi:LPXTG cell wall anchor domain-containing protein [Streptomyces bacillaris]|uniref:LPXTG cell wall anchor domain-containing protein n=1 Tax=Streptomyces bacillaris TaxID=68179 RepID=UPI0036DF90D3